MRPEKRPIAIERLANLTPIWTEDSGLVLVFLFGSYATDQANTSSDLDLALLLSADVSSDRYLEYRLKYGHLIANALRDERIDIVLLNTASPLLAHEVIKGRILFERSAEARVEYIVNVQRKYLDLKPFYAIDRAYMRQRLKEGTFGQP